MGTLKKSKLNLDEIFYNMTHDNMERVPDYTDLDEIQEKSEVFRYFYRCDKSRSSPGSGLGLSLVKAIIEKHRGDIFLEDADPGLCVKIYLQPYQ